MHIRTAEMIYKERPLSARRLSDTHTHVLEGQVYGHDDLPPHLLGVRVPWRTVAKALPRQRQCLHPCPTRQSPPPQQHPAPDPHPPHPHPHRRVQTATLHMQPLRQVHTGYLWTLTWGFSYVVDDA